MKNKLSIKNLFNKIYGFTFDGTLEHYGCYLPEKKGFFSNFILNQFFKRITIDEKQVENLNELSKDGIIVFASKYKSNFNYIFMNTRFRNEKLPFPEIGMEHKIFLFQPFRRKLKIVFSKLLYLIFKFKLPNPYKSNYINNELLSGKNGFISLICKDSFYGRYVKTEIDPIQNLIELQQRTEKTIYIVPKMMVYSLNPRRSKPSIIDVLFGRQENPGAIRRFAGILKSKKNVFVEIAKPFSIKEYLASDDVKLMDNNQLAVKLRTHLIKDINKHRQIVIGPVLKTRDELKQSILTDENLEKFMLEHGKENNLPIKKVHKKADGYIDEIASNYSKKWIDAYYFVLTWMFKNIFDGINIDYEGLKKLREASKDTPLLIMPCHKSHLDYLIISYVMFANNMACPQIAAGKNLSFWPLGTIFRGGGAFFIRRTFKGVPLYAKVFKAYVEKLIYEGFNIEFFIEGGRSRSGKLLSPKIGLLSIVLEAFLEGKCEDLNIVPIFIGYDRVLEEGAYLNEIEGGKKEDESVSQIFKARKFLKKRYGKVYVKFSDPLKVSDLTKNLDVKNFSEDEKKEFFKDIGYTVINAINNEAVVTAFGIVAGAFLNSQRSSVTPEQLMFNVTTYYKYLKNYGVNFADTLENDFDGSIKQAIETYERRGFISIAKEGPRDSEKEVVNYKIIEQKRPILDYYKNNCLNHFIPGVYTAIGIIKNDSFSFKTSDLTETYCFLQNFFIDEFSFDKTIDPNILIRKSIKFYIDEGFILPHEKEPDTYEITAEGFRKLHLYARFIKPYLESYKIVLKYLNKSKGKDSSKNKLKKIHSSGNKMIKSGEIERVESVSRINFRNGLTSFERVGILDRNSMDLINEYKIILNSYIKIIN
ncbi:MAG: glycerol-3-phosphate acyltransferase [Desulfobacterales bacterium]|nr:glycerol-3-phosphate acyltransferase [Desulfobacterales bacterium]MCP4160163.1 glycerol-3-phosphate acyltransferase [Deltaproteobacteria bacterium]